MYSLSDLNNDSVHVHKSFHFNIKYIYLLESFVT